MAEVIIIRREQELFSVAQFPTSGDEAEALGLSRNKNAEVRAMTIAAFRIAQNDTVLSDCLMDQRLANFLLADSASMITHWKNREYLRTVGSLYRLTAAGLALCESSLEGLNGAYSTDEAKVLAWTSRMTRGGAAMSRSRIFDQDHWNFT